MKVLSLFSGGGLGDFGLELAGMEIIGQVEIDDYCQKVLTLRWPSVPKWRDICEVKGKEITDAIGHPDLISGGFPCQDISVAGRGVGITGERSGLWKEMFRLVCEIRPRYVFVENVTALLGRGLGTVLGDLSACGYDAEWDCIPARAVGAPHRRDRIWIVAYSASVLGKKIKRNEPNGVLQKVLADSRVKRLEGGKQQKAHQRIAGYGQERTHGAASECSPYVADAKSVGRNQGPDDTRKKRQKTRRYIFSERGQALAGYANERWRVEPRVGRMAYGVAHRVDRLKLLGNGQVVQVVQWIAEKIVQFNGSYE